MPRIESQENRPQDVLLTVPADNRFAATAGQAIQGFAGAFGMPAETGMALGLAGEEIIAFAAQHGDRKSPVALRCRDGRYRMIVELSLSMSGFDPRFFNLTQQVAVEDEQDVEELGLLLTARTVDNFSMVVEGGQLRLSLEKIRPYPVLAATPAISSGAGRWSLKPLTPDRLARFCRIAAAVPGVPRFLRQPGRLADMAEQGELAGSIAERADGSIAGGCLWSKARGRVAECYGPYVEPGAEDAIEPLVEACIVALARSPALGVICRNADDRFPAALFDSLGQYGGEPVYYRQLQEDMGAQLWVTLGIRGFLADAYRRLGYARDLMIFEESGQRLPEHSVISVATDSDNREAVLRPCWPGTDAAANVAAHRQHLAAGGLRRLAFEIDLGVGWQLGFVPGMLAEGFRPAYVIPNGGSGDLLTLLWSQADGA
jgi:anti-sigma regulatory factor (Ser/Thr protein kinase)